MKPSMSDRRRRSPFLFFTIILFGLLIFAFVGGVCGIELKNASIKGEKFETKRTIDQMS